MRVASTMSESSPYASASASGAWNARSTSDAPAGRSSGQLGGHRLGHSGGVVRPVLRHALAGRQERHGGGAACRTSQRTVRGDGPPERDHRWDRGGVRARAATRGPTPPTDRTGVPVTLRERPGVRPRPKTDVCRDIKRTRRRRPAQARVDASVHPATARAASPRTASRGGGGYGGCGTARATACRTRRERQVLLAMRSSKTRGPMS